MPDAYVIEVSGRTAGIVARDSQNNSFNFYSALPRFKAIEGQRFSDPLAAERADENFDETGDFGGFPWRHFARRDCRHNRGIPGSYEKLEAVVDPNPPNHAEAKRFSPKFLLNDTVAPAERVIPALAIGFC